VILLPLSLTDSLIDQRIRSICHHQLLKPFLVVEKIGLKQRGRSINSGPEEVAAVSCEKVA
jgi:hypothetical protein